jgi:uncharacterized protein (TIGR02147 family)
MVRLKNFREDASWISKKLRPSIQEHLVKQTIEDLLNIGLLERDKNNRLQHTEHMLVTSDRIKSSALTKFNEKMNLLSLNALKRDPVAEKEYSFITIAVPKGKIPKIKEKIRDFRRELHSYLENAREERNDVVQISFQLFNLTRGGLL